MNILPQTFSALMRRCALRTAMVAARGVIGAVRGKALAASRGNYGRVAIGSDPC